MSTDLSADELRAVADEARDWGTRPMSYRWWRHGIDGLSLHHLAYAEGVIAERKRSRAVRVLAVKLAGAFDNINRRFPGGKRDELTVLLDECRDAGLLSSDGDGETQR